MKLPLCILLFALSVMYSTANAQDFPPYHEMQLEGWKVYVEQSLVNRSDPRVFKALRVLRKKLRIAKDVLPSHHIEKLRNVPLWMSNNNGRNVEYYFFEDRVYRGGINPKMLGGIEFKNISLFLAMQHTVPSLIIHEFAHAYHKYNYKNIDKFIMRAFRNSIHKQLYKEVSNIRNHIGHAEYASKNAFEYFADLTVMYYGKNTYYPHDRSELKKHDPMGFKMIEKVWE